MFTFLVDAGFRPGSRATFVSVKVAKTIDAQFGSIEWDGRKMRRTDQLAMLKQGPLADTSVRPKARTEGVGHLEKAFHLNRDMLLRMQARFDVAEMQKQTEKIKILPYVLA